MALTCAVAMLVAVLWLCKLGGCANTSVAVLICQGNFTDMLNKLPGTVMDMVIFKMIFFELLVFFTFTLFTFHFAY